MIVSTDGKTAHWDTYVEPEKVESTVYFKNTVNWPNVYFYGGVYWDDSKGSGSDGIAVGPVAMTKVDGTDDLYTCTVNAPAFTKVAFTKDSQKGYGNFHQTEAVYSADFNSATPLFTPDASATSLKNNDKTTYYEVLIEVLVQTALTGIIVCSQFCSRHSQTLVSIIGNSAIGHSRKHYRNV